MLAQECPIMHPTKNKSETKFVSMHWHLGTTALLYIYIYIYIYIVVGYAVTMT